MENWEEEQKKGYDLTKGLKDELFHVEVFGPASVEGKILIHFLDGVLRDTSVKVESYEVEG